MNSNIFQEAAIVVIMLLLIAVVIKRESNHNSADNIRSDIKFEDILSQLDFLMEREMAFSIELPFEGRDVKRLTDFEESLHMLTHNVTAALNEEFFAKAKAAGLRDDFLLEYITRGCTIRLLKFIKDNNAGYTGGINESGEE